MMQGYERSKIKMGERPAIEEEREIYLPDEYRMGAPDRVPMMVRAFDPDREGSMMNYMTYKKGGLHKAASQVRGAGRHDDTMLIHVNEEEFQKMREMFGDPIINPETGLPEYGFFKSLKKAFKKNTKICWIESPTNPTLKCVDIAGVVRVVVVSTAGGCTPRVAARAQPHLAALSPRALAAQPASGARCPHECAAAAPLVSPWLAGTTRPLVSSGTTGKLSSTSTVSHWPFMKSRTA